MILHETAVHHFGAHALTRVAQSIFDEIRAADRAHDVHIVFRRTPAVNEQNVFVIGDGDELFGRKRRFHSETFFDR